MSDDESCPLCREAVSELQFHHWDYDKDIGVSLCPGCHYWIHGGERATDQENSTKKWGATTNWENATLGWRHNAVNRVILADLAYIEDGHRALESINEYVQFVTDRYEIPAISLFPDWILEKLVQDRPPETLSGRLAVDLEEYKRAAEEEGWWSS